VHWASLQNLGSHLELINYNECNEVILRDIYVGRRRIFYTRRTEERRERGRKERKKEKMKGSSEEEAGINLRG